MYAVAIIRYRRPLEEVLVHQDAHRAILLLRVGEEDFDALDALRDNDPFVQNAVAQYELLGWVPVIGKEDLDRL